MSSTPMRERTTTPWVAIVLAALLLLNPIGLAFISQALSGDPLSSGIATPFVVMGAMFLLLVYAVEHAIRRRRKRPQAPGDTP